MRGTAGGADGGGMRRGAGGRGGGRAGSAARGANPKPFFACSMQRRTASAAAAPRGPAKKVCTCQRCPTWAPARLAAAPPPPPSCGSKGVPRVSNAAANEGTTLRAGRRLPAGAGGAHPVAGLGRWRRRRNPAAPASWPGRSAAASGGAAAGGVEQGACCGGNCVCSRLPGRLAPPPAPAQPQGCAAQTNCRGASREAPS